MSYNSRRILLQRDITQKFLRETMRDRVVLAPVDIPKLVLALLKNLFFSSTERVGVSRMNSSDVSSSSK